MKGKQHTELASKGIEEVAVYFLLALLKMPRKGRTKQKQTLFSILNCRVFSFTTESCDSFFS